MKRRIKNYLLFLFTVLTIQASGQAEFKKFYNLFNDTIADDLDLAGEYLVGQKKYAKTKVNLADYHINSYLYYSKQAKLDLAMSALDSALLYVSKEDKMRMFEVHNFKALLYYKLNQFDKSFMYSDSLLKSNNFDSVQYLARLISNKGNALIAQEEYNKTINLVSSFLDEKQIDSITYFSELYDLNQLVGNSYYYLSNFDSAIHWYIKSANLPIDKVKKGRLFGSIAQIYTANRDADNAIDYYTKAINSTAGTADYMGQIHNYYNLGDIYQLVSIDSSYFYYKKSYDLSNKNNYNLIKAYASQGLGNVCMEKGNYDTAIFYNQQSIALFKEIDNKQGIVHAQMNLGKAYSRVGNFNEALFYGRASVNGASTLEGMDVKALAFEHLYDIFYQKKQFDSAIFYYQKFELLEDTIRSVAVQQNINDIQIKYETELTEKENLKLSHEVETANANKKFWIVTLLLLSLLFVFGLLIFIIKNKSKKQTILIQKQDIERERVNKELALANVNKAKELIQEKNNVIQSLEEESKNIDVAEAAESLIAKINTNQEWLAFMAEFEMIYKGFFSKFQANASTQLTQNDNRLGALMKLNLSNKEISEVLFISYDSVKKAKQRLTKKIKLKENQKLIDLVLSL